MKSSESISLLMKSEVNLVQCHCVCAMKDQSVFNCTKDVLYNIKLSKMSLCETDIEDSA